ncbi:MAG TPA: fumarylacetoacetate hydrolase family protein [Polyangiaceae bacterium]|nr:fumarylacetoacetate hydrolase family protein [Polyangiaceae bacterium]
MTEYVRIEHNGEAVYAILDNERCRLLDRAPWLGAQPTGREVDVRSVRLLAPVAPSKIIGVGRNYAAHARELDQEIPKEPLWFLKAPSSLLDPGGVVVLPFESQRVDHEAELGVVIGRRGRRVPKERALEHVFGYTIVCDVTARDLQRRDGQWTRAKSFDTFCPVGPGIVTDIDVAALGVRLHVGAELRQSGNTRSVLFDVSTIVAHVSAAMTLEPGDLISTGTPEGVGPLADGDDVTVDIDRVGQLSFRVVREDGPR